MLPIQRVAELRDEDVVSRNHKFVNRSKHIPKKVMEVIS